MIRIHPSARLYGNSIIGENSQIMENVVLGYPDRDILKDMEEKGLPIEDGSFPGAVIGENALIRANCIIYSKVRAGDNLQTGHSVLIREKTNIGSNVLVGTNVVIEGDTAIGNNVSLQSNAYIPANSIIEDFVFIGPNAVLTNDKYPVRKIEDLKGPIIRRGASIGANATILPGVEVGEGAIVAAGAVVSRDVAPWKLAIGSPARVRDLPEEIKVLNRI